MDEDRRIYVAIALIAAVAVGSLFVGRAAKAPARAASDGGGWRSRLSAFGLVTPGPAESSPAASSAASSQAPAGLSAPEPMMTKAATRLFSSPSSGSGGIAGAEPPPSSAPDASASAAAPRVNLVDSSPNMPGGSNAPSSGGLGISSRGGAGAPAAGGDGRAASASSPGRGGSGAAGFGGGAGPAARGTGPGAAGDATAAGKAAQAFNGTTDSKLGFKGGTGGALSGDRAPSGGPPGGADSKAPGLPDVAAGVALPKDKSAGSAAAAGGGGGASGGGGGASGGAGMSGGPPAANAKTDGAGGPQGGPSGPTGGTSVSGGADAPVEASASIQPMIGVPRVGTTTANGGMFRLTPNGPAVIPTFVNTTENGRKIVGFTAKLAIDADGAGPAHLSDRTGQNRTALLYRDGSSLNPTTMPYIVVPTDFGNTHPNVQLGDYATVTYGSKSIFAIVGDKGPPGVLGEGSIAVARAFGINSDPNRGGSQKPEFGYRIVAGSRDPEPPRDAARVQARGRDVFESAGAPVR